MSTFLRPNTGATITVAASDKIATWSLGKYSVDKVSGYPNLPATKVSVYSGTGLNTSAAFTVATQVTIQGGPQGVYYETGTGPVIPEMNIGRWGRSVTATALNTTGALTSAMILGGIVTSTTAAAVAGTVPTGSALDAVIAGDVGDYFDWSVINTGPNTFTVTAASGHTLVGVGAAVVTNTSTSFRTVKTAAATFITYCLASAAS